MTKPIVYYIDDSEDALELAKTIVADDERFTLVTMQTNAQLINTLKKKIPAAVIIDLNLGNDVTGTIIAIKLNLEHPNLPLAIYTAYEKERVQKLLAGLQHKVRVWQKSEVGVDNLADEIINLINS